MAGLLKRTGAVLSGAILIAGCAEGPTAPIELQPQFATTTGAVLVECPSDVTRSVSGTLGLLGGTLELDGTRITLPFGAVLLPTQITLTLPASPYMEVDITANGVEHFEFQKTVGVSISYARCSRSNIEKAPLSVWHIDPATNALLENMGGTDDKVNRTVTFGTEHLSGFSIAQ